MQSYILVFALTLCCWGSLADIAAAGSVAAPKAGGTGQEARVAASRPMIELHNNLLSVRVRNVPWPAVLQEIEHHTGIVIRVQGALSGTLTQEFEALPLQKGLWRLFRQVNAVFFSATGTQAGTVEPSLMRIWLFPQEENAPAQSTPQPAILGAQPRTAGEVTAAVQGDTKALRQAVFEPDPLIQAEAFTLLARRDPQKAVATLVEAAQSEQAAQRLQALHLLHQIDQTDNATVVSALRQALTDQDMHVRGFALQALAEREEPDALAYLYTALRDPDPSMRRLVIEGIVPLVQRELGLSLLQEALSDDDETVRSLAVSRLERTPAEVQ